MIQKTILRALYSILFVLICSSLRGADDSDRKIQGFVRDAKTSEPLAGATVMIRGTGTGVVADVDGRYLLQGLSEGKHTLVFQFLSYKTVEIECRTGERETRLDVSMESDDISLSEVYVSARMRSNTETAMLTTVRSLPQVANGISSAQIAKSPDRMAAEVVRRVSGVTIIDDRFIIVRGLAQRYNHAWINGLAVPSTEADSRAFPLDLVPSSQIDNLLIYKSPSPEIPGDFSGGFVKITSKSVPDENSMEFGYTTGFNTKTHGHDFRMNPGSSTDFLGFDAGKRTLSGDFPAHLDAAGHPDAISRLTREGFNNDWRVKTVTPIPDQRLSLMIARRKETSDNKMIGNVTSLTYGHTSKGVERMKNARYGIYSALADMPVFLDNYNDDQYTTDVRLGVLHNWSVVLNPFHRIEFKNLFNLLGSNRLTERTGIKDMSSMYYREQTEMRYSSRLTYSGQFSGTHDLSHGRTWSWDAGYSYAGKNEPDRRIVTNQAGISSMADIPVPTGNDNINRYFQDLHDHTVSAAVNYKQTFSAIPFTPTFKAGLYGEYHSRDYHVREFIYRYDNLSYDERQSYLKLPFEQMLDNRYLGADKVYIDEITRKTNNYDASVWHGAGYAALEVPIDKWTVYTGLRLENHHTKMIRDRSDASDLTLMNSKHIRDLDLLPSVNVTYRFSDRYQLRAAYGRSLNRPELRELSPTVYFDFDLFSEIGGNENLKTAIIDNLDLRGEFYPAFGETVSLGVFYKHFKNPVEWTFIDMGGSLRYNYENAEAALSWGIELDARKKLDFMGMKDFSLVMNAALIESRVHFRPGEIVSEPDRPMQGQSPYVINVALYYQPEKYGLNASLLYNRIGRRIVGLGKSNSVDPDINTLIPDSYEMPRNALDFTFGKSIGRNVELRCSVRDILSEYIVYKQFPKFEKDGTRYNREQTTRQYSPGQSISVGISYKIK
ncbi:MAG: TonB-dependent receptor [Tannerella sp.]|jgi:outer membrane receptor protein involved in Fe transport|nr:TonB-dependent receptor [Tannerella sp.]